MKKKLLALALLAGSTMFAETRFSIGVNLGGYNRGYYAPPPPVYASVVPPCPGPGFVWVDGYWSRNNWIAGYWNRPAYIDRYYVAPRYEQRVYERSRFAGRDWDRGRENRFRGR